MCVCVFIFVNLLQFVMVKLERLVNPLNPVLLPSCHFLYQRRFRSSARNVPGFGWRNAFGSNHPPPSVVDQANGHQKDACRCLAQLESSTKICQTLSRSNLHNTAIPATQQHHAPSVQKLSNHPHLNCFVPYSIQE